MVTVLLVEVAVHTTKGIKRAFGLWRLDLDKSREEDERTAEAIVEAMNLWWEEQGHRYPVIFRHGWRYTPLNLCGPIADEAVKQCSVAPVDSPKRFVPEEEIRAIIREGVRGN